MHIAGLLVSLGFPPMDKNLHDNVCPSFGSIVSSSQTPQRADSLHSILGFHRRFPCVVVVFRMRTRSSVLRRPNYALLASPLLEVLPCGTTYHHPDFRVAVLRGSRYRFVSACALFRLALASRRLDPTVIVSHSLPLIRRRPDFRVGLHLLAATRCFFGLPSIRNHRCLTDRCGGFLPLSVSHRVLPLNRATVSSHSLTLS